MRRMRILAAVAAAALTLPAVPLAAREGTTGNTTGAVTSVSVIPATGRAEVVVAIAGTVNVRDFALTGPDRIVVDFENARLRLGPRFYDRVNRGGIRNVRVAQNTETTVRLVLDMDRSREYTLVREPDGIRISIAGEPAQFVAWRTNASAAAAPAERSPAAAGSERPPAAAPAERSPAEPPAAPPAPSTATTRSVGGAPLSARSTLPPGASYSTVLTPASRVVQQSQQQRVSVAYFDTDIREVIASFAAYSNRTIVPSASVQGRITAEIIDQPWDIALRAILEAHGLSAVEDPVTGIITIDSYLNILNKKATEPLVIRLVPLNYARAESLAETIRPLLSKECPQQQSTGQQTGQPVQQTPQNQCPIRGAVIADVTTNTLVISEVISRIEEVVAYAQDLDVRTPQVQIKAKIIFVNRTDIEDMGVTYDLGSQNQFFNRVVQRRDPATFTPVDLNGDGVPDAIGGGSNFEPDVTIVDIGGNALAAIANASQQVANPALSLIFSTAIGKFDLTAFLDALQEVRLADIQAEPSITTLDNRQAEIVVGEQTPIRTINPANVGGGITTSDIEFKETGIILRVTPHVTNNRQILMTLESERSALQPAASDLGFTFTTQRAQNQLLVNDGETAVIGGLTVTQLAVSKSGIPILVDLPFIGRLFGQTRHEEEKRDLLILVTPHIVDDGQPITRPGATPPPGR